MRTKRKEGSPLGISMCKIMCVYEGYIVRLYRKKCGSMESLRGDPFLPFPIYFCRGFAQI